MKKILILVCSLFIVFCYLLLAPPARADQIEDLNNKINEYQSKLTELSGQKKTLSSTLAYLNTQISLTQSQIAKSQQELILLQKDIDALTEQIGKLNLSLDELTTLLSHRVRGTYIQASENLPLYILLSSNGVTDMINRYKYLQVVQGNDKKIMVAMERSRQNYDLQKTLKEQKQSEVEAVKNKLNKQKTNLLIQQQEKNQLMEITKNDEKKYQALLSEAIAQRNAFNRYVTSQGGASILTNQTKCDGWGCYYNQRDAQWGNNSMGGSGLSIANYGCFITSVAMIASHGGIDIKPPDIAANPSNFTLPDSAYLRHEFSVNGKSVSITVTSASQLDDELKKGPVIVGLFSGPDHFIIIKEKKDGGYIMNDPFLENGSDKPFSDKYETSNINSLRLVSFQ